MSSEYVRNQFANFYNTTFPTDSLIPDLACESDVIKDLLAKYGLTINDSFIAFDFIGSDESPVSVASNNTQGKYREVGSVFVHVSEPYSNNARGNILTKTEEIRSAFRGQRIGDILIESVTPPNFDAGATLQFQSGFTSAAIIVNYERDLSL